MSDNFGLRKSMSPNGFYGIIRQMFNDLNGTCHWFATQDGGKSWSWIRISDHKCNFRTPETKQLTKEQIEVIDSLKDYKEY